MTIYEWVRLFEPLILLLLCMLVCTSSFHLQIISKSVKCIRLKKNYFILINIFLNLFDSFGKKQIKPSCWIFGFDQNYLTSKAHRIQTTKSILFNWNYIRKGRIVLLTNIERLILVVMLIIDYNYYSIIIYFFYDIIYVL